MKALQVNVLGQEPSLAEIEIPEPGPGQVLVDVAACGLNFADILMIKGQYQEAPDLPFTPGMEMAGRVAKLGPGCDGPPIGTRVAAFTGHGGLAEFAVVPQSALAVLHDIMPTSVAAGFQVAYGTSHLALTHRARLRTGERLLVLGAAGGVGLTAVELGASLGAEVIACARGADKLAVAREAGAHHLIDSETGDLRDRVRALGGADVVFDPVGGAQFGAALRAVRPEGRMIVIGFASGDVPPVPANIILVKNISVLGFYWGGYLKFAPQAIGQSLRELFSLYAEGKLKPHISHTLPLDRAVEGIEILRTRKSTGKVVITCGIQSDP